MENTSESVNPGNKNLTGPHFEGVQMVDNSEIERHLRECNIDLGCTTMSVEELERYQDEENNTSTSGGEGGTSHASINFGDGGVRNLVQTLSPIERAVEFPTGDEDKSKEREEKEQEQVQKEPDKDERV